MSKAKELLPKIMEATSKTEAIEVLHSVLQALYLTNNYTDIVALKDRLKEKEEEYSTITNNYESSEKELSDMIDTRTSLNFLYRDISDSFTFDVNRLKIFYEEQKSSIRALAIKDLKEDVEAQEMFNAKSTSALRDVMGYSSIYREFTANYSIAYGLYKNLETLLNSIRMFIDLMSSTIKTEQLILQKDAK